MLSNAGELGPARTLTGLALDVTGIPGQVLNNWTIRIKHTTMTSYGLNPVWDATGWTVVLQTNLTINGTGWVVLADPEGNEFCVERSAAERAR